MYLTSYDRTVLITGEAMDAAAKAEVEKIVTALPGVKATVDELQISGISSLGARTTASSHPRSRRALLTMAVSSGELVRSLPKAAPLIRFVCTRGEADAAVEIARTTGGVLKVVRVFEVISDEDARLLDNRPAGSGSAPTQSASKSPQANKHVVTLRRAAIRVQVLRTGRSGSAYCEAAEAAVFTNGRFDLLHRGHVTYLAQARALGASMVVALNSDASVKRLGKGDDRPLTCFVNAWW